MPKGKIKGAASKAYCKVAGHSWNGCKCERCGEVRDEGHSFVPIEGKRGQQCEICGKVEKPSAKFWETLNNRLPFLHLEKKPNRVALGMGGFLAALLIFVGIMAGLENNTDDNAVQQTPPTTVESDLLALTPTPDNTPDPTPTPTPPPEIMMYYAEFPDVPNFGYYYDREPISIKEEDGTYIYEYTLLLGEFASGNRESWEEALSNAGFEIEITDINGSRDITNGEVLIQYSWSNTAYTVEISNIASLQQPIEENPIQNLQVPPSTDLSGSLVAHIIDVGQGDSILIQLPNGETMLIDGGESNKASSIRNYMSGLGITKIDYLVATHPHADHIGGLPNIIDNVDIGAVYMPRVSHTTQTFEKLLDSIENKGLQIDTAKAGVNILDAGSLSVNIVAPVRDSYNELNDYSAVIHIRYGNTAFLFTGDAEELSEGQITADIASDVLKVGHHGSNSSTSAGFLRKVAPLYAVISCGTGNSYGHPTDNTLNRLYDAGIEVYRTDLQGTIIFTSDGENITVNTEPAPKPIPTPAPTPKPADPTTAPEPQPTEPPADDSSSSMVWLSATGSKFHRINNCGTMNPDKARQVSRATAIAEGKTACSNCNP